MNENLRLVFVQLGPEKTPHLWLNIERVLEQFPDVEINLVVDSQVEVPINISKSIKTSLYTPKLQEKILLDRIFKSSNFRNGFWRYTFERLLALTEFHIQIGEGSILHIESDLLLMPNFPFENFEQIGTLAWMKVDKLRDTAALLYSPNKEESIWLSKTIIGILASGETVTDMTILRQIADLNPHKVVELPTFARGMESLRNENKGQNSGGIFEIPKTTFSKFGIFDPAAIGMWLTGIDPRNNYGTTVYFDTQGILRGGTFLDPSKFRYQFTGNELLGVIGTYEIPIWCLHVHSKNLGLFSEAWKTKLQELILLSKNDEILYRRSLMGLVKLIFSNLRRGTLLPYLLNTPKVLVMRKVLVKFIAFR
jgi:hypothetical protein